MDDRRRRNIIENGLLKAEGRIADTGEPDVHDLSLLLLSDISDKLESSRNGNGPQGDKGWRALPRRYGSTASVGTGFAAVMYLLLEVLAKFQG